MNMPSSTKNMCDIVGPIIGNLMPQNKVLAQALLIATFNPSIARKKMKGDRGHLGVLLLKLGISL